MSDANLRLQAATTRTSSGAGPAFDLGAVRAPRDLAARVRVTALTGTATFTVEHSHDGVSYATAGTATGGTCYAPGEYVLPFTARRRYARLAVALSGGSPSVTYAGELAPIRFGEAATRRLVDGLDAPAAPTVFFTITHDDGTLDEWDWSGSSGVGTASEAAAASAHDGAYGLHSTGTSDGGLGKVFATAPTPSGVVSARGWFKFLPNQGPHVVLNIDTLDDNFVAGGIQSDGTDGTSAALYAHIASRDGQQSASSGHFAVPVGQWHLLETVRDDRTEPPVVRAYVDGALAATVSDASGVPADPSFFPSQVWIYTMTGCEFHADTVSVADGVQGV